MIDYGKMPYMSQAKDYVGFMKETTDQVILSQGGVYAPMDMKKPYMATDYQGMVYTFQSDLDNLSGLDAPTLDDAYVSQYVAPVAASREGTITVSPFILADDGHWTVSTMYPNEPHTAFGKDAPGNVIGSWIRIPNVALRSSDIVISAVFTFVCRLVADDPSAACNVAITGNATNNATIPITVTEYKALARTGAVLWNIPAWAVEGIYYSPDVSSIVQEIISRPGWAEGNALLFLFDDNSSGTGGNRRAYSVDGSFAKRSSLKITIGN